MWRSQLKELIYAHYSATKAGLFILNFVSFYYRRSLKRGIMGQVSTINGGIDIVDTDIGGLNR